MALTGSMLELRQKVTKTFLVASKAKEKGERTGNQKSYIHQLAKISSYLREAAKLQNAELSLLWRKTVSFLSVNTWRVPKVINCAWNYKS